MRDIFNSLLEFLIDYIKEITFICMHICSFHELQWVCNEGFFFFKSQADSSQANQITQVSAVILFFILVYKTLPDTDDKLTGL